MTLNTPVIRLLVAKDWQLFQKQLAIYVLAGIVALRVKNFAITPESVTSTLSALMPIG